MSFADASGGANGQDDRGGARGGFHSAAKARRAHQSQSNVDALHGQGQGLRGRDMYGSDRRLSATEGEVNNAAAFSALVV